MALVSSLFPQYFIPSSPILTFSFLSPLPSYARCGELEFGPVLKYPSILIDLHDNAPLKHVAVGEGRIVDPMCSQPRNGGWQVSNSGKFVILMLDSDEKLQELKTTYVSIVI
ncbi:hypothetical protein EON65_31200 [archaeon]|nr:MAG: hypothetical protein EON65_31200 [archaeon]